MDSSPPRLFAIASRRRSLWALTGVIVLFGLAMLPAIATMADHGASVIDWESAGSVALLQDVSLALILSGHVVQPWPRIAAVTGPLITACVAIAALLALTGMLATRKPVAVEAGVEVDDQRARGEVG